MEKLSRAVRAGLLPATDTVYIDYAAGTVTLKPSGRVVTEMQIEDEAWGPGVAITGPTAPRALDPLYPNKVSGSKPAPANLNEIFGRDI